MLRYEVSGMNFPQKLQLLRKQSGLSQEELGDRLGVSRQSVAKWESGQACPDIDNLICLSDCLHVSIDKLVKEGYDDTGLISTRADRPDGLAGFLCRAKRATYAGKGAEAPHPSRPQSHDLHYREDDWRYIDSYLGGERFIGEEAVWNASAPVWGMNYAGRILLSEAFSDAFFKEALRAVPADYPYRGPRLYQKGDYTYHCLINGALEWFQGYEEVFCRNENVYECFFHGGNLCTNDITENGQ